MLIKLAPSLFQQQQPDSEPVESSAEKETEVKGESYTQGKVDLTNEVRRSSLAGGGSDVTPALTLEMHQFIINRNMFGSSKRL